jgi:glyoxylase-like metal-dependent hydrolase (beta-lactamase superfamily II)
MAWHEIGDRVFAWRYPFLDQQIGVVLGGRDVLVVDTRASPAHARELASDLRELTRDPVSIVVDTHWHWDPSFGNPTYRPAESCGHVRAAERLRREGEATVAEVASWYEAEEPDAAAAVRATVIDPPERTFEDRATVELGGRIVELRYHGRAHTDGDITVLVPDANVLFAGDLLEAGAAPSFGDSFPLEWPDTVAKVVPLAAGVVVPGHGALGDRAFVEDQLAAFRRLAELARAVHQGSLDLEAAQSERLFHGPTPEDALPRALAQLRGELS